MTQVDLEALAAVCAVGSGCDRKITCETLAEEPVDPDIPGSAVVDYPPDCPPESFWLSKDAEFDWFDRNAFLDRKESIKGNSNSMNLNPNVNSSSLQFFKSKPAIISLPKGQKMTYVDSKRRNCKLANIWLFPKRSDSIGKEPRVVSMVEPSSPKVSCIGRVRSKSCPNRRRSNRPASAPKKSATQHEKTGIISRIKSLFRSDCHGGRKTNKSPPKINSPTEYSPPGRNNVTCNSYNHEQEAVADKPALGGDSLLVRPKTRELDVDLTDRQPLD